MTDLAQTSETTSPKGRNYWLLLLGGASYMTALQFGNPQTVLPWIASTLGVALFLIALIVPVVQFGQVLGQLFVGPQIAALRGRKTALAVICVGLAAAIGVAAGLAGSIGPHVMGVALIACAAVFGMIRGLYTIAHQDILASLLTPNVRGPLMARRAALGGVLTMAATLGLHTLLPDASANRNFLLWIAVALWLVAACIYSGIAETPRPRRDRSSPLRELSRGIRLIRTEQWFGDFLRGRTWLLTVELAIPFYTIHVATLKDSAATDLVPLVFAISAGLLIGGPVWGRLVHTHCHLAIAAGASLLALAGACTLLVDEVLKAQIPYFHVLIFIVLSFGRQGVIQGRNFYLSAQAPADDRPIYISIAESLMGTCAIGIALALGLAAQFTSIFNPLLCLVALNMTAAVYALEVFGRTDDATAHAAPEPASSGT